MQVKNTALDNCAKIVTRPGFEPQTCHFANHVHATAPPPHELLADAYLCDSFTDIIEDASVIRNSDRWIATTQSPPAKRSKSFPNLVDVTYEDETCMTCINLFNKFLDMQKDIDGLKAEIEKLKKRPSSLPKEKKLEAIGAANIQNTFATTASLGATSNRESGSASTRVCTTAKNDMKKTSQKSTKVKLTKRSQQPKKVKETSEEPTPPTEKTAERSVTSCQNKVDPGLSINWHSPHATPAIAASLMEVSLASQTFVNEEPGSNSTTTVTSGSKDDDNILWHQVVAGSKIKPYNPLVNRSQCIVIKGMPESASETPKKRIDHDMGLFQTYVKSLLYTNEEMEVPVLKAFRMGQKQNQDEDSGQPRPTKFILKHEEQAKLLMSRKPQLRNNHPTVFFQRDYSPAEREKWRALKTELHRRSNAGERNLRIMNGEITTAQRSFLWRQPITLSFANQN